MMESRLSFSVSAMATRAPPRPARPPRAAQARIAPPAGSEDSLERPTSEAVPMSPRPGDPSPGEAGNRDSMAGGADNREPRRCHRGRETAVERGHAPQGDILGRGTFRER